MRKYFVIGLLVCICSLSGCGSKEVVPEEKDITILLEDQGGETPKTTITPTLEKWSMEDLSGDILKASGDIAAQFENHSVLSSSSPSLRYFKFASSEKMREYVSLEAIKIPVWELLEMYNNLTVYGNEEGQLQEMHLETGYETENVRIQSFARVYLEAAENVAQICMEHRGVSSTVEEFHSTGGIYFAVTTSSGSEYGYCSKDAYWVEENILYNFHMAYQPEHEDEAVELLEKWMELW